MFTLLAGLAVVSIAVTSTLSSAEAGGDSLPTPFHLSPAREKAFTYSIGMRAGDFLFVGGITAVDEDGNEVFADDIAKQTEVIYSRLKKILDAHGVTPAHVVREEIYYDTPNGQYFSALPVRAKFYEGLDGPQTSGVRVSGFTSENIRIEVTAVVYVGY